MAGTGNITYISDRQTAAEGYKGNFVMLVL